MNKSLAEYVQDLKARGLHYDEISSILVEAGWSRLAAASALRGEDLPAPPTAKTSDSHNLPPASDTLRGKTTQPIAVVSNLSVRGFEYSIMFITLWAAAVSLGALLHDRVDQAFPKQNDMYYNDTSGTVGLALTVLLVSFPIFATMFIRLKKAERRDAELQHDPSRRKLTQLTQLVAFLFGMGYIIYFIYRLIVPSTWGDNPSVAENFLHMLVTVVIAGGIFAFYWFDDHRKHAK
jgi:hypothetical protein